MIYVVRGRQVEATADCWSKNNTGGKQIPISSRIKQQSQGASEDLLAGVMRSMEAKPQV